MSTQDESDRTEPVWRALANGTRRAMLDALRDGALTTGDLAGRFPAISRFAVMQHLKLLEEAGLVVRRKRGREVLNHLNPTPIQEIYNRWVSRYQAPWTELLIALRDDVERNEDDAGRA
jgi:DNA-binding transcriptional ArsR family regulator